MPSLSREGERHRDRAGDLTPVLFGTDTVAGLCRLLTGFSIHPWSLRPRHPSASLRLVGRCYQTCRSADEGRSVPANRQRRVRKADCGGQRRHAAEGTDRLARGQVRRQPQPALRCRNDQERRDAGSDPAHVEAHSERPAAAQPDTPRDRQEADADQQLGHARNQLGPAADRARQADERRPRRRGRQRLPARPRRLAPAAARPAPLGVDRRSTSGCGGWSPGTDPSRSGAIATMARSRSATDRECRDEVDPGGADPEPRPGPAGVDDGAGCKPQVARWRVELDEDRSLP